MQQETTIKTEPAMKKEDQLIEPRVLDPRTQILVLILISVIFFSLSDLLLEVACMVMIGLILIWQGMWKTALKYWAFYAGTMLFFLFSLEYPNMLISMIGILCVALRKVIPSFMFATAIIEKTKVGKLVSALQEIRLPKGLIIAFAVTIRFFPTLKEEYWLVINAMRMRGIRFSLKNLILRPMLVMESILIPIMLRMSVIADELAVSSVTRGIDSNRKRTSYYKNRFIWMDGVVILIFSVLAILAIITGN